jgi:hypothetical protein
MRIPVQRLLPAASIFVASLMLMSVGAFAEPVAEATSAVPKASYSQGGPSKALEVGSTLNQNDRIRTDANGAAEIEFVDGTSLTVGANSEVVLDKMLFDGDKARNATIQIVRGTLRFVTGNSNHDAYQIKTPVATIGVRGTVIDISLEKDDMVFNTVEGVGVVCRGAECRDIRAGDRAIAVNRTGFRFATAAQSARLLRIVNGAHTGLSRRIGRDPRFGKGWQKRSGFDSKRFGKQGFGKQGLGEKGKEFGKAGKPSFRERMGQRYNKMKERLPFRRKDRDYR